ncbi:PcfK-like family protein [Sphingobacterium faecium]|uniref:PcfK-like family protein n=1 Tax=Sphingobacterium faecium TaxID=34087 RepID=UPI002468D154|nr:Cas9 inhibitor AcrIIA9 family protein [Sphingobacterium faecium]MDH5825792.1 Cas9 inhibitor AcrIIA9 family protein [Sphingobacterium faecium]
MKASDSFTKQITEHLESIASADSLFAQAYKKANKSITECINYIFTTVHKSGCNGFADEEIYAMAIHYYDEDDIKDIKDVQCEVVVNHSSDKYVPHIIEKKKKDPKPKPQEIAPINQLAMF